MDESGINLNFDLDESDQERILEIVKSDLVDSVLSELPASEFPNFDFYELRSRTVNLSTSLSESPTLKTEVVRSRTQLKQQLMRDQELMKEQERRRIAEEESAIAAETNQEPISIPVNVNNVELPPCVLQVSSALENPTRYHILAKRKHQVMQYLNSSDPEDFVSKFDAQKATLQMNQQHQQLKMQINQRQQVQDQQKQQTYQKKQFQQQQRILQRRQVQKRKEVHMEYKEQWYKTKLEQMENMDYEAKLEHMQLMEYEEVFNDNNHEREMNIFRQQQNVAEEELQQQLIRQHQLEQQQLLHRHQMEKQQLQHQFQLEKQQLHQQQEQLKLHQQLLKRQRQKELQKKAEAEDKAEAEALVKAQAEIRARIRRLLYGEPSSEAETKDDEQKKLQEADQGKTEADQGETEADQGETEADQGETEADQGKTEAGAEAPKETHTEEQPQTELQLLDQAQLQLLDQAQLQLLDQDQLQLLVQNQLQEPMEMQDEARALPLEYYEQRDSLRRLISDLAQNGSIGDEKSVDMHNYDVYYTMSDNLYGPFQWSLGEPDSLSQDDSLNMKWTRSCPPGLEHYDADLSPYSLHHAKSRIRKDNHNIVERRRRSNINDRIKELADLLPKVNEPYYEVVKDSKNNKGGILKAAVEYVKYLKLEMMRRRQAEINNRQLQEEKVALMAKVEEIESKFKEKEKEMLMRHQAWMIVKRNSIDLSVMKDDEMDKNKSNESEKSECGSSQCELMEEDDTDEDEIC